MVVKLFLLMKLFLVIIPDRAHQFQLNINESNKYGTCYICWTTIKGILVSQGISLFSPNYKKERQLHYQIIREIICFLCRKKVLTCSHSLLFNFRLLFVRQIVSELFNKLEIFGAIVSILIVYIKKGCTQNFISIFFYSVWCL